MIKLKLFALSCLVGCLSQSASADGRQSLRKRYKVNTILSESKEESSEKTISSEGVMTVSPWSTNWVFSLQGGGSVAIGSPYNGGCLGDHLSATMMASVGKWFTPGIGFRAVYQGFKMKDYTHEHMNYNNVRMDLMYNVSSHFKDYTDPMPRWDVIPYFGMGITLTDRRAGCNSADCTCPTSNHPFTLSYGVQGRWRVAKRLHIIGEIGMLSTFANYDGHGDSRKIGDNLLTASVGLAFTVGKVGWRKHECASSQDSEVAALRERVRYLEENPVEKIDVNAEGETTNKVYPKNDYNGLNSLRKRMAKDNPDTSEDVEEASESEGTEDRSTVVEIGVPVYFFFQVNTDKLKDDSQLDNLDELAQLAKDRNLVVKVTGAADSYTGSVEQNKDLSRRRAKYIAKELMKRGVRKEQIHGYILGGINKFNTVESNRHTKVVLHRE